MPPTAPLAQYALLILSARLPERSASVPIRPGERQQRNLAGAFDRSGQFALPLQTVS